MCVTATCPPDIGPAFAQHYYNTFDTNRVNLQSLYKDGSLLTFENEQFMGMQSIMTKLTVRSCTAAARFAGPAERDVLPLAASGATLPRSQPPPPPPPPPPPHTHTHYGVLASPCPLALTCFSPSVRRCRRFNSRQWCIRSPRAIRSHARAAASL